MIIWISNQRMSSCRKQTVRGATGVGVGVTTTTEVKVDMLAVGDAVTVVVVVDCKEP